jgi:putative membrane protein
VGVIYYAYAFLGIEALDIKMSIATVLGFAVALLLAFRTSASYDRWWEARKVWGGIVNDSRTLIRQVINFTNPEQPVPEARQLAYYQMAWCHSLKNSLRELDPLDGLDAYLTPEDLEKLTGINNVPNHLLMLMEKVLFQLRESGQLDAYQFVTVDQTLKNLCDHMGKCERINNTVFPIQYHSYTYRGIVIFTLMLPYGMLFSTGPFVILICTIVAFIFLMLDQIAAYLQDPFNNTKSDIPMSALSRTIEINLRQMIGDHEVPEPLKPDKNGILM